MRSATAVARFLPLCRGESAVARGTHPLREECLPSQAADSPVWSEVRAVSERAGGLAWKWDRHDRPMPTNGLQVCMEEFGHLIHPRPAHVRHQAGRTAQRKFYEPSGHLPGVDRLEPG